MPYVTLLKCYNPSYKAYCHLWRYLLSTDDVPLAPLAKSGNPPKKSKEKDELERQATRHNIAAHAKSLGFNSDRIAEVLSKNIHYKIAQYITILYGKFIRHDTTTISSIYIDALATYLKNHGDLPLVEPNTGFVMDVSMMNLVLYA